MFGFSAWWGIVYLLRHACTRFCSGSRAIYIGVSREKYAVWCGSYLWVDTSVSTYVEGSSVVEIRRCQDMFG